MWYSLYVYLTSTPFERIRTAMGASARTKVEPAHLDSIGCIRSTGTLQSRTR